MNPLAMKRKMFQEMKDVSKADGADALRAKYGPQDEPPPEAPMDPNAPPDDMGSTGDGTDSAESEPVPGTEGDSGSMDGAASDGDPAGAGDSLAEALSSMSEDEIRALLAGH